MTRYVSQFPDVKIVKNSMTHNILEFSKFYAKRIGLEELQYMNPTRYTSQRIINRPIFRLQSHGLIDLHDDNTWEITSKGIAFIYDIAKRLKRETVEED